MDIVSLPRLCSSELVKSAIEDAPARFLICFSPVDITEAAVKRMNDVMDATGASIVYSDYFVKGEKVNLIDMQPGVMRDDFDFGKLALVDMAKLPDGALSSELRYAAFYELWLGLTETAPVVHIPEPLYDMIVSYATDRRVDVQEAQFDYVDPRNTLVQDEMERVFTRSLKRRGALVGPLFEGVAETDEAFDVDVSVVIPVRNRVRTVADAIDSALAQRCDGLLFNVIVVDNHSDDGTTELIDARYGTDGRVVHLIPEATTLGIGGCWNFAINNEACGRYAVQLDSDDVYAHPHVLSMIYDKFITTGAAMVVGSYTLTDAELNPIPPGLIAHREWTEANGPNNLLRVNGMGAPRAFFTPVLRSIGFPDVDRKSVV